VNFAVVTEVSPEDYALALDIRVAGPGEKLTPIIDVMGAAAIALRAPVFTLGEIMILDEDGRELVGAGRKPNKWFVTTEDFDSLEAALERAREVLS
jgi:hypothetical protein